VPRPRIAPFAALIALTLSSLWLAWSYTHTAFVAAPQAIFDDALFVRLGNALLRGEWLGPYDNMTLAKGPFYPMFLAAAARTGISFLTAQAAATIAAVWLLVGAVRKATGATTLTFLAGAAIALNPIIFSSILLRPTREGIYVPLTMLCCGALLYVNQVGVPAGPRRMYPAALLGFLLAAFWLTREEGLWLVPPLAAAWAYGICTQWRRHGRHAARWQVACCVTTAALVWTCVSAVERTNRAYYGVTATVEFKQDAFIAGYNSLARIISGPPIPYVAIPFATLRQAAAASPAAARLLPDFESATGRAFADIGCSTQNISPCDGEIRNGWFMWALRDAVQVAGGYKTASTAKAFYRQLTGEIDRACVDGQLRCGPLRTSMAPQFAWQYIPTAATAAAAMIGFLAREDGMWQNAHPVTCAGPTPHHICAAYMDYFRLLGAPLFVVPPRLIGADETTEYATWQAQTARLPQASQAEQVRHIAGFVHTLYAAILPWAVAAAALAFAIAAIQATRSRCLEPAFLIAAFCVLVVVSRVALLAYVDTTAIPAINAQYLAPTYPFLLLFTALAPLALWRARERKARGLCPLNPR